jgi:hypothetical protein
MDIDKEYYKNLKRNRFINLIDYLIDNNIDSLLISNNDELYTQKKNIEDSENEESYNEESYNEDSYNEESYNEDSYNEESENSDNEESKNTDTNTDAAVIDTEEDIFKFDEKILNDIDYNGNKKLKTK